MPDNTFSACGFIPAQALAGLPADTPVLVALSGGADSSLLLHLTVSYANEHGGAVYAAHVNHGIRGASADSDEEFCRELCRSLGVTFFSLRADVPSIARESRESIEGAARRVRYEFFAKIMRENSIVLLATAHNADDNLETQIFNLARGTGLAGLSGIPRVRECEGGTLVRPILDLPKRSVLNLCAEYSIPFVTDATNSDTDYSRNRIRAFVIPELEKLTNSPQSAAARCADILREDERYLSSLAEDFLQKSTDDSGGVCTRELCDAPAPIRSRAVRSLAARAGLDSLEAVHYDAVMQLAKKSEAHSSVDLPQNFCALIEHGRLYVLKKSLSDASDFSFEAELFDGITESPKGRFAILVEHRGGDNVNEIANKFKNIYNLSTEIYLKSATIKGRVFFRTKKEGDVILHGGMHKKLRKLLGERSVHPDVRARLPLLCDDDGIIWAPFCATRDGTQAKNDDCDLKITLFIDGFI